MKTFKKSLAVLTTAAILSSSMAVVAYAAASTVTWTSDKITTVEKYDSENEEWISFTSGSKASKIRFKVAEGTDIKDLTLEGEWYKLDILAETNLDDYIKTAGGGGATGQPDAAVIAADSVVWVNGKDVKAKKGTTDPSYFYKTETYQQTGQYAGGKWAVQAVPKTYGTDKLDMTKVENFLTLFDEKGKFNKDAAKAAKDLASAKIKDGQVTVTAGKKDGEVVVWVYEINSKKVACDPAKFSTPAEKVPDTMKGVVDIENVAPMSKTFTVKMASSSPAFMSKTDYEDAKNFTEGTKTPTKDGAKKAVSKTTLLYKDAAEKQDAVEYYIVDKKATIDAEAHWDIDNTGKNAFNKAVVNAELKDGKLTITPTGAGKTNVVVKNYESGKSAKFAVTVSKAFKVTVGEGVEITYKDENKKEAKVTGAATPVEAWILEKTAVKVSADAKVGDTDVKAGKTFKVEKGVAVTKAAAAAEANVTLEITAGATVKKGDTALTASDKVKAGDELTITTTTEGKTVAVTGATLKKDTTDVYVVDADATKVAVTLADANAEA